MPVPTSPPGRRPVELPGPLAHPDVEGPLELVDPLVVGDGLIPQHEDADEQHEERGGRERDVPSKDLVPGDILLLQAGRRVPADGRLLEAFGLAVDESSLTGESIPAEKDTLHLLPPGANLADFANYQLQPYD
jgi:hypothetical protein